MKNVLNDDLQLEGKKVLLRVDFNVPINKGAISETSRIEKIIPTINFLLKKKAKIIILSHIGRPKGKLNKELSLKPISEKLGLLLNEKILFNDQKLEEISLSELNKINNGSILMLENIRFNKGEENNDDNFSKKLSKLGDIYVNDAFSCCHRSHASIEGITKYIPSYFGFQITEEINALKKITSDIKNPVTLIIGGAKISTKIQIINNLIKKFDNIVIVGGMANTVLKYKGINIGKSISENDYEKVVKEILDNSKKYNCKVLLPVDVIVAKDFKSKGKEKKLNEIDKEDLILDIGTKTIYSIKEIIDKSNSIL